MSSPDHGPLLGSLLRVVHQAVLEQVARWLAASEFSDIQPAHFAAIQPLWERPEGVRLTSLARSARITKQSMSALVDHLETTRYVERVDDPGDARASLIRLTPRGRAFGRAVRTFTRSVETDWARRIGAARITELKSILLELRETLAEPEG
jgi:DNA-binding MarR family transcriptional regulator